MIGKSVEPRFVPNNAALGSVTQPTATGSSSPGVTAAKLGVHAAVPMQAGGPLQTLQASQAHATPAHTPATGRAARYRERINVFVTATCSKVPGTDARHRYLAAEAVKLQQSLRDAIRAAKTATGTGPVAGKTKGELIDLLEKAMKVHHELSQWKGTPREDEVKLLQQCMDMYDQLERAIAPRLMDLDTAISMSRIGRKAHAIYFRMATGVDAQRTPEGFELKGTPCAVSQVKLLECARAAAMNSHAETMSSKPQTLPLAELYTVHELQDLPLGEAVDGSQLTQREIELWCADPPQNPWPVEPRLLRFYEAARHAAWEVSTREHNAARRERLAQDMPRNPDPHLAVRDNRDDIADLVAGFAADLPDDRA